MWRRLEEIARRARGTPRIANRLLRRVRDFAHHLGPTSVTLEAARWGLEQMEVDDFGLDHLDRQLLTTIIDTYDGGPVGLKALAASIGEDRGTLEDIHEPYLAADRSSAANSPRPCRDRKRLPPPRSGGPGGGSRSF